MVQVARKIVGSGSERARRCWQVARRFGRCGESGATMVGCVGGLRTGCAGLCTHWRSAYWWRMGARVVEVAHKVAGSGSERAHACVHVFASAGSRGKHGGIRGRLVAWSCAFSIVHVYCPSAQWRHVGAWVGSGRPQWWRVCAWVGQVGRKAAAYLLATTRTLAASKDPSSPTAATTQREIGR